MKTIEVEDKILEHCSVKAKLASELTRDETDCLMNWCGWQDEDLWSGLNLQEILNVYRVSAEYQTWEDWYDEDKIEAYKAWNRAVIDPGNEIEFRE